MSKTHTLLMPLDMHLHLRDEVMLHTVAPLSSYSFSGALVMPNLVPPIKTLSQLEAYKKRIIEATANDYFEPYMTLFYDNYDKALIEEAKEHVVAIKLYPEGITTNSEGGVSNFDLDAMGETLQAMSDAEIVLSVHGETNGFVMDREKEFLHTYELLASNFPELKIVMEHITTKESVALLEKYDNLYATITLHHLCITLDDVAGGMLKPHLFCKPIAKRPEDKAALLEAALSAHPKVMFGSDSAPHPKHKKEACGCAAGVFTAPIALQVLCELFDNHGKLQNLQLFVSDNAQNNYGICAEYKEVTLVEKPFHVPEMYGDEVVPLFAGETINWSIENIE